jgi:hypothetical protein
MIIEERDYLLHPGKVPEFLKLYETECFPVQTRILGNLIGFFTSEIGELNHVVHLWGYSSLDERARRRALLFQDEGFQAYFGKVKPLIMTMTNRILVPTSFSPIKTLANP